MAEMDRCGVTSFCAPPTVWRMLIQADLTPAAHPAARGGRRPASRSTPRSSSRSRRAWGVTIRDGFGQTETAVQVANTPGQPVKPGSMGRPMPGYTVALLDPVTGEPGATRARSASTSRTGPVGLMTGYHGDAERTAEAMARRLLPHRRHRLPRRRRLHHLRRPRRRRLQGVRLQDLAVRAGERAAGARGGRRGRRGARARPAAAGGAQGVRRAGRRAGSRRPETAKAIFAHSRACWRPYKRIRRLEFAELPKTISGKIRRIELRERDGRRAAGRRVPRGGPAGERPSRPTRTAPAPPPLLGDTIGANLDRAVARVPGPGGAGRRARAGGAGRTPSSAREVDEVARGLLAAGRRARATGSASGRPTAPSGCSSSTPPPAIGAVMVNINPAYRPHELEYVLHQAGITLLVASTAATGPATTARWSSRCAATAPSCGRSCYIGDPSLGRADGRGAAVTAGRAGRPGGRAVAATTRSTSSTPRAPPASPRAPPSRTTTSSTTATSSASWSATPSRTGSACRCPSTTASAW